MAGILFLVLAVLSCPYPISLLSAIVLHEAGHLAAAFLLGWGMPSVNFGAAGIRLCYRGAHKTLPSVAVSLAGSLAGVLSSLIPILPEQFRLYSLGFAFLNLLPILRLDGGGALLAVLEAIMLPDRAYRTARTVSAATVLLLWALSVAVQLKAGTNLTLLAVSVYLTVSALTEGR